MWHMCSTISGPVQRNDPCHIVEVDKRTYSTTYHIGQLPYMHTPEKLPVHDTHTQKVHIDGERPHRGELLVGLGQNGAMRCKYRVSNFLRTRPTGSTCNAAQ